jgi:hypothetical protein
MDPQPVRRCVGAQHDVPHKRIARCHDAHRRSRRRANRYHQLDRMTVQVIAEAGHEPEPRDSVGLHSEPVARAQGREVKRVMQPGDGQHPADGRLCGRPKAVTTQPGRVQDVGREAQSLESRPASGRRCQTARTARSGHKQYPAARPAQRALPFRGIVGPADPRKFMGWKARLGVRARRNPGDHLVRIPVHAALLNHSESSRVSPGTIDVRACFWPVLNTYVIYVA